MNKEKSKKPTKQVITDCKYHSKPTTVVIPQARKPTERDINDRDNHLMSQQNRPHTKKPVGYGWSDLENSSSFGDKPDQDE